MAYNPSIRTRTIRNSVSARVSVPSLLYSSQQSPSTSPTWNWRTDLTATQPFWKNWFVGLSSKFLEAKGGKLLLLAGTDRLDKELMIGQMQGDSFLIPDLRCCEIISLYILSSMNAAKIIAYR